MTDFFIMKREFGDGPIIWAMAGPHLNGIIIKLGTYTPVGTHGNPTEVTAIGITDTC